MTSGSVQLSGNVQMTNISYQYTHNGWYLTFTRPTYPSLNQQWYLLFDSNGKGFNGHFVQNCCGYQGILFPVHGTLAPPS